MKTTIERRRDDETGGVRITITLNPADLEGLGDYRRAFTFDLCLVHADNGRLDEWGNVRRLPNINIPLPSEFSQLLAQVIVAELVANGSLPPLNRVRLVDPGAQEIHHPEIDP